MMHERFTLGVVPYLNALPLYRALEERGEVDVMRFPPSQLSGRLVNGECDAALMPIVDFLRGVGGQLVGDACIASNGAVQSVLLFSQRPLQLLRVVAVDKSSHTSVALLRILLADAHDVLPRFLERPPSLPAMLERTDAALLIGDAALEAARACPPHIEILDLGTAWKQLTGLPFVFAAWISQRGLEEEKVQALAGVLNAARDEGERNLEAIVDQNPIATTLSPCEVERYLRTGVEFHLTPAHHAAIAEFRQRCAQHELL